jgi:hypothetical protein
MSLSFRKAGTAPVIADRLPHAQVLKERDFTPPAEALAHSFNAALPCRRAQRVSQE